MSTIQERRLARMPSAQGALQSLDVKSPLANVRNLANSLPTTNGDPGPSSLAHRRSPPVPVLDFNLFRSNSVYSVSSINTLSSFDSAPTDDSTESSSNSSSDSSHESGEYIETAFARAPPIPLEVSSRVETPTTPKAERTHYFDLGPPITTGQVGNTVAGNVVEESASGQVTPKKSFFVRSRRGLSDVRPPSPLPPPAPVFSSLPTASTSTRSLAETHQDVFTPPIRSSSRPRADSITREGEISALHPQRQSVGSGDWESVHGEQGSEWGDDEEGFEWLDQNGAPGAENGDGVEKMSPRKRLTKLREAVPGLGSSEGGRRKLKKQHVVIPRRAAPPPPPGPGSPRQSPYPPIRLIQPLDNNLPEPVHPVPSPRRTAFPDHVSLPNIRAKEQTQPPIPTTMPLRDGPPASGSAFSRLKASNPRNSGLSIQSTAFSLYDLDGKNSPSNTPRASPGGTELVFPKGTYTKVPASILTRQDDVEAARRRGLSEPSRSSQSSPLLDSGSAGRDDLLAKGLEARGEGDLPKAAWYFRQAADAGSTTGRIYWGLALRHGWGVARDERKAFGELRTACDDSLAQGSREIPGTSESGTLSLQQKRSMARDISLGMFEVANCFLDGVGVKKDPEVAVSYLRFAGNLGDLASQEQLGFLLSKGGSGIKKDMKEAAKWYRMAIGQGTTTSGLAWVWKEKYMT